MKAETILASLNRIAELYAPGVISTPEYEKLAQGLREEIAMAEQKRAGKADRFKAALRFSKKCRKEQGESRPALAGAYIGENGRQYIFHPHMAVRYENPFDGLVEAEEGNRPVSLDKMMDSYDSSRSFELPELGHLKTMLKLDKADGKLDEHGRSHTSLNGVIYSTEYLIQLIEMVEPKEAYFSGKGKFPMLVAMGEGSTGILCPIRVNG